MSPDRPVTVLAGVGPARAARFARLGVETLRDLLFLQPRRLECRGDRMEVAQARGAVGGRVSVLGKVTGVRFHRSGRRRSLVRARISDGEAHLDALFFNQPWQRDRLRDLQDRGIEVELYGQVVDTRSGPALASPRLGTPEEPLPEPGELSAVYPATEGLGQGFLRSAVAAALDEVDGALEERLSASDLERLGLPVLRRAVRDLHLSPSVEAFVAARRRVALESILALQARMAERRVRGPGPGDAARAIDPAVEPRELFAGFPFEPTDGQVAVLEEILADLARRAPMRRLLQGDVGCGKTAVALAAALAVARNGGQVALLAPTELLAEQHYAGLAETCAAAGAPCVCLTASRSPAERRAAIADLAGGRARVAIGTHALYSGDVAFQRLDLALIDEQQRFGVAQRRALLEKGEGVHALLMTATPIPRTLALTLYGDLEVSLLAEHPPGRGGVRTRVVGPGARERVLEWVGERLAAGERGFWVVPRIEQGDGEHDRGAEEVHRRLQRRFGADRVELVHGRQAPEQRAEAVDRFRGGRARLLVGTTVIEVGVDVPEATLLVVDGADRLGLAQLHQLRGRVGRGPAPATCVLLAARPETERLLVLAETDDGFRIAEADLARRGMGDLAGLRQSGEFEGGLSDPSTDAELLLFARDAVADSALRAAYLEAPRCQGAPA